MTPVDVTCCRAGHQMNSSAGQSSMKKFSEYRWTNTGAGGYPGPNAFGTVGIRQRVAGLLKGHGGGANVGDHDGPAVAAQRVLPITQTSTRLVSESLCPRSHTESSRGQCDGG